MRNGDVRVSVFGAPSTHQRSPTESTLILPHRPYRCNVPFTWFVSGGSGTNCGTAQRLLADNHELATHTFSHAALLPASVNITVRKAQEGAILGLCCALLLFFM